MKSLFLLALVLVVGCGTHSQSTQDSTRVTDSVATKTVVDSTVKADTQVTDTVKVKRVHKPKKGKK